LELRHGLRYFEIITAARMFCGPCLSSSANINSTWIVPRAQLASAPTRSLPLQRRTKKALFVPFAFREKHDELECKDSACLACGGCGFKACSHCPRGCTQVSAAEPLHACKSCAGTGFIVCGNCGGLRKVNFARLVQSK